MDLQKRLSLVLSFMLFFSVVIGPVFAHAAEPPPLSFAILKLAPYAFTDENGVKKGYLYDVMTAVLEDAGIKGSLKHVPLKRLLGEFKAEAMDCTLIANSPIVGDNFRVIEPIGKILEVGILPVRGKPLNRYEDLRKLKIAVPLGVSFDKKFNADTTLEKIGTKDYTESINMLTHGRIDAIAGSIDSLRFDARQLNLKPEDVFDKPLTFVKLEIVLACAKHRPSDDLITKLKNSVISLRENGQIKAIIAEYL